MSLQIHIHFRRNRWDPGVLLVRNEAGAVVDFAQCLGKADSKQAAAHSNASRNPEKPWGDTPTGAYEPTRLLRFEEKHPVLGGAWIPLEGASGQAERARRVGGRSGLGIHAGRGENLMATYGCVRLRQADFDRIAGRVEGQELTVSIEEV